MMPKFSVGEAGESMRYLFVVGARKAFIDDWVHHHNLDPRSVKWIDGSQRLMGLRKPLYIEMYDAYCIQDYTELKQRLEMIDAINVSNFFDDFGIRE